MISIPPEIWHHVARFVPDSKLRHLLSVNNVFLEIGMDLRWKNVTVDTRSRYMTRTMCILSRLSDHYVARRVKHLSLYLCHDEEDIRGSQESAEASKYLKQQFGFISKSVSKLRWHRRKVVASLSLQPTLSDVIDGVIDAMPRLVNVTELKVDFWVPPPRTYPSSYVTLFASQSWASFCANLRLLELESCSLEGYQQRIESKPCLKQLEKHHMSLHLNPTFDLPVEQASNNAILNIVAPFVDSVSLHLKVLDFRTSSDLDCTHLFKPLMGFPVLQQLEIRSDFKCFASDPSVLKQLLCRSSETIETLDLRLHNQGIFFDHLEDLDSDQGLTHWLAQCIEDESCFSNLRYLAIYPTYNPDTLVTIIQRASKKAASLCPNLTHLSICVRSLTVATLDLLAAQVPMVEHLYLSVKLSESFLQDIQRRRYLDWKLKDLSLWYYKGVEADRQILEALARSVPSITSFFGTGHKQLSPYHKIL